MELESLSNLRESKGKTAALFQLKNKVVGSRKASQEPTTIIDPDSGAVVFTPNKIKETILKYCKNLLTNRMPHKDYEEDIEIKRVLHKKRMDEKVENDISSITVQIFNKSMEEVWKEKKTKYQFILNAGNSLKNALFHLYRTVWEEEVIPQGWTRRTRDNQAD